MINPSTLDLKTLPWLPLDEKTAFPKRPAIYFAIDSLGNIQYIGRAKNVRSRWSKHHKYEELNAIGNIKIAYLFIDLLDLLPEIETALIEYFNPPLNIQLKIVTENIESKLLKSKRQDPNYTKVTADIEKEIASKTRAICALTGISLSDAVNEALKLWIEKKKADEKFEI
ncbi:GIY-YIG nuclease family protein [Fischerella sp. PCC 9605]|uniref:GIY-YIG nuclease family protein n=1 Tax=Fischerella sp. PCC 9605 TaxID=1173024 RepID=UPI0004BA5E52|nr:GIY-YIG nuclease family protein [Fischerella sp. PCC 9605]